MRILDYIPTGHKNAISRQMLSSITKLGDRQMRDLISEVNSNDDPHELIINLQDGKGYFRPAPDEENLVRIWRAMENSRGLSINANVNAADRYLGREKARKKLKEDELEKNQMSLFDFFP